jgi:hypothetical protein
VARRPPGHETEVKFQKKTQQHQSILRLPDLEHAKSGVLNSLNSADAKRGYRHAIDEFVDWYCSAPRLAFNRIVVLRYRSHLESRQLAPGTINLRLGAVRRLAYEAAGCGLLSADLAAGIRGNVALVACFPLLVNTIAGLKSADEDRINLMRSLAASRSQIFWMLRLPSALPFVMAGLEVSMIFALIGAIVAEFVGSPVGLGMLIQSMNFNLDVAGQFSVLLILSIMGLLLNRCILLIRRRILFWDTSEKPQLEQERVVI